MNEILPYPRRKRVLMLTTDTIIDRRILHEGEALISTGYEVILLAGSDTGRTQHELIGRVKVQRIGMDAEEVPSISLTRGLAAILSLRRLLDYWRRRTAESRGRVLLFCLWFLPLCLFAVPIMLAVRLARPFYDRLAPRLKRWICRRLGKPVLIGLETIYVQEGIFYRPDIIHVHDLSMLAVGAALKRRLGVPLFYDMHESYPDQPRLSPSQRNMQLRLEAEFIGMADIVVTVNDLLLEFIRKRYTLASSGVVQNSVLAPHFDANLRHDRFREDYPQLAGKFLVLYQGWIAEERNLETAIQAMAKVTREDIVLLIMGYGDYARKLQALAMDEGVADRVLFVPAKSQAELLSYSASADIGLIPYPTDRDVNTHLVSPNKLYEFITARLPILTNQLPFVQRVICEWEFGEVANLNDVDSFAAALNQLDRTRLHHYKERLAEHGWRFGWEEEQKVLIKLYESLPGQEPPARVPSEATPQKMAG